MNKVISLISAFAFAFLAFVAMPASPADAQVIVGSKPRVRIQVRRAPGGIVIRTNRRHCRERCWRDRYGRRHCRRHCR